MKLWIVGELVDLRPWEVVGVFTTEELAVANCRTPNHFVGPLQADTPHHAPRTAWEGAYFPHLEPRPDQAQGVTPT